jgi:hypothetical protein
MKPASEVLLAEYPKQTWRELTPTVKDKVLKRNSGFEQVDYRTKGAHAVSSSDDLSNMLSS